MKKFLKANATLLLVACLLLPAAILLAIIENAWVALIIWGAAEAGLIFMIIDLYKRQVKNKQND